MPERNITCHCWFRRGPTARIAVANAEAEIPNPNAQIPNNFQTPKLWEKQRTALARAIIKNPPILILDDAFSSVDVETEEEILRELKQFMKGRTTLLISHRISTVRDADMIVYLRGGRIIELGTHDELVAGRGAYYELYQRQKLARQVESMKHQKEERP